MSGSNAQGAVLGASTTASGAILLPNTGGSLLLTLYSFVTIGLGLIVLSSFAVSRFTNR